MQKKKLFTILLSPEERKRISKEAKRLGLSSASVIKLNVFSKLNSGGTI